MAASTHVGVHTVRALVFGVHTRAPDFWKLPYRGHDRAYTGTTVGIHSLLPDSYVVPFWI